MKDFIIKLLNSKAGQYFNDLFKDNLKVFLNEYEYLIKEIDNEFVLVLGDINYNNILIKMIKYILLILNMQ